MLLAIPARPAPLRLPGLVLAAALAASLAHAGPAGRWENIAAPSQTDAAVTFDSHRGRMVVFGGDGTNVVHVVPTSGPPAEWTNLATTGTPPAARTNCGLAYDATGDRLILFGGQDIDGNWRNDLWQLALSGTPTWSPIATGGSVPSPRASFGACFDQARRLLVVFGGVDSTGNLADGDVHQVDLGQPSPAWSTWTVVGGGPDARQGVVICDDPAIDGMVAFGGDDGGGPMTDAYTMSYGSHAWTPLAPSGDVPTPAADALVAFDPDDTLLFVWGGAGSDDNMRTLSPVTGAWTIRPNVSWQGNPSPHTHPLGIWVPGGQQLLMLDGDGSNQLVQFFYTSPSNTYWQEWLDPGDPNELRSGGAFVLDPVDNFAVCYGGANSFGTLIGNWWGYSFAAPHGWEDGFFYSTGGTNPTPRQEQVSVWDTKRDRMLTFGGSDAGYALHNDTYAMSIPGWFGYGLPAWWWDSLATTGAAPSPRTQSAGIYDPVGDRVLLFGGLDAGGYPRADLWQLSLAGTPAWSKLVLAGGPTGRCAHSAIYDAPKHRMLVFGGEDSLGAMDNDVWALNLPALTWTHLAPSGTAPPGRYFHTAVYDSRRERMLVFGGTVSSGDPRDTWELSLAGATPAWTKLAPTTLTGLLPSKIYQHAAVYDSTNDRMLVYGGLVPPIGVFGNPYAVKDLWSLQFDFSGGLVGVPGTAAPLAFAVGEPWPNPARAGTVHLAFALPQAAHVRVALYDISGRRVRTLADGVRAAGPQPLEWDGRDEAGRRAAPGLYFCRIDAGRDAATRRIVLVRP